MEIKLFLTYRDFISLSEFILTSFNAEFAPEEMFDKPTGHLLTSISEIEMHLERYSKTKLKSDTFFITSPYWSVEPIFYEFMADHKNMEPFYYGQQKYGGPSFHFIPTYNKLCAKILDKIVVGTLSDYSYYISGSFLIDQEKGYKTIDRPEAMKKAWKDIKKFLRQNGQIVIHKGKSQVIHGFAMNDAISDYKNGVKLLQGDRIFELND